MELQASGLLLVGVEVSVALAGFAGIIATFQFRDVRAVRRPDVVALSTIVQNSLWCALGSALPPLLYLFGMDERTLWSICSTFAAVLMAGLIINVVTGLTGTVRRRSVRVFFSLLQVGSAFFVVCNVLNAADVVFHREPGPYIAAIMWGLSLAAYMFVRLLLYPLWRSVRQQEATVKPDS